MAERLELAPLGSVGPTSRSYWVVEGRFAAGAYPGEATRSERPPEVVSDLLAAGIDTFVNLTEDGSSGPESFLNRYDDHVEGVAVVQRFPIVDVSIPSVGRLVESWPAMRTRSYCTARSGPRAIPPREKRSTAAVSRPAT